jgi:hypothetical protein
MSIEAMRQARNAFVWNLNTDLDNIPACEQWANMLRKNIDDLDKAIADAELKWVGLTEQQIKSLLSDSKCWIGDDCSMPNLTYIIRAVEKAHGIGEK